MEDLVNFAKELTKETGDGFLKWVEGTSFGTTEYSTEIGVNEINIRREFNQDTGTSSYILRVIGRHGEVVGILMRHDYEDGYDALDKLMENALNSARELDKAISEIRTALKKSKNK